MVRLTHVSFSVPTGQKRTRYIIFDVHVESNYEFADYNHEEQYLKQYPFDSVVTAACHPTLFKENPGFLTYFVENFVKTANPKTCFGDNIDFLLVKLLSNNALPAEEVECLLTFKQAKAHKDLVTLNPAFRDYVLQNYRDEKSFVCLPTMCSMEVFFDVAFKMLLNGNPAFLDDQVMKSFSSNPGLTAQTISQFPQDLLHRLNWVNIFNNTSVVLTREMVAHFLEMDCFEYDALIRHGLMRDPDLVNYAIEIRANDNRFKTLSANKSVVFTPELVARHATKWDWTALSANEGVQFFTQSVLINHQFGWVWELVLQNPSFLKCDRHMIRAVVGELAPEVWDRGAYLLLSVLQKAPEKHTPLYPCVPPSFNIWNHHMRGQCTLAENEDGSGVIRVVDIDERVHNFSVGVLQMHESIKRMKLVDSCCEMLNDDNTKAINILQECVIDWRLCNATLRASPLKKKVLLCTLGELPLVYPLWLYEVPLYRYTYEVTVKRDKERFDSIIINFENDAPEFIRSIVRRLAERK